METRFEQLTRRVRLCPLGLFDYEIWELVRLQQAEIERLRTGQVTVIQKAMTVVSVGGRTYPNRLRSLTTHYAIQLAVEAAEAEGGG